jgi:hypothetical protein
LVTRTGHAIDEVLFDPIRQCGPRKAHDAQRRVIHLRCTSLVGNGEPDLEWRLRGEVVHAQSRQQADDGLRVFACHLGQRAMLGYAAIWTGIQTATHAGEQALPNQPREGDTGQTQRVEIARAYEAPMLQSNRLIRPRVTL